jgi:exonuclease VII large subunit
MLMKAMRQKIESERLLLSSRTDLLHSNMRGKITEARSAVEKAMIMIRENDPRNIFSKGYAAVTDSDGHILPGVDSIEEGCSYTVRMRDGSFTALASDITKEGQNNGR